MSAAPARSRARHDQSVSGVLPRVRSEPRHSVPPPLCPQYQPKAQLVIVEVGADIGAPSAPPPELDQTALIAQLQGETSPELAQRSIQRIASLERSGLHVVQVMVFLAAAFDAATMAARRVLSCAVLSYAQTAHRPCELVFVDLKAGHPLRRELWKLIEQLVTEPGSSLVPIRLRFPERKPPAFGSTREEPIRERPASGGPGVGAPGPALSASDQSVTIGYVPEAEPRSALGTSTQNSDPPDAVE